MKKILCGTLSLIVCAMLTGCGGEVLLATAIGPALSGTTANAIQQRQLAGLQPQGAAKNETDSSSLQLENAVNGERFIENVQTIAGNLGYRVVNINSNGPARSVTLSKKASGDAKMWMQAVSLSLESDGRTIQISAQTLGSDEQGGAKKLVNELKENLTQFYTKKS